MSLARRRAENADKFLRSMGLDPSKPLDLASLPMATWSRQTHTPIMLGHGSGRYDGRVLRLICDSTGGIVELPCDASGDPRPPYPRCRFCGLVFGGKEVMETTAEIMVDTDHIDAWPGLPWWPDE